MFVMPVFAGHMEANAVFHASSLSGLGRPGSISRSSVTSSQASHELRRAASTSSNKSTSTSASSIESPSPKSRYVQVFFGNTVPGHRRFQKKLSNAQSQETVLEEEDQQQDESTCPPAEPRPAESTEYIAQPSLEPAPKLQSSDLVVRCKRDSYHVDQAIMCYYSRWFRTVCAVVAATKSSRTVIDLSADDSDAVAAMIQYCYQLDYTDQLSGSDTLVPEAVTLRSHVDVFMLAERYGISGLKCIALQKFEDLAVAIFIQGGYEEQLLQAIRYIYASGRRANADALRYVVIQLSASHVEAFINGDEKSMCIVYDSMDEIPEFRADLFDEMALRWK